MQDPWSIGIMVLLAVLVGACLPVLFQIQFWLLDVEANLWIKFAISSFGTLAIGILTYAALIRWSPIGWMLNGRRDRGS